MSRRLRRFQTKLSAVVLPIQQLAQRCVIRNADALDEASALCFRAPNAMRWAQPMPETTTADSIAQRDVQFHLHHQTNPRTLESEGPTIIAKGEGCYIVDGSGQRLFEGMSGLWCVTLGFSEKRLAAAAARQMAILPYYQTFRGASTAPLAELAAALVDVAPKGLSKAFFQSSGSEANDTAFKIV